MRCSSEADKTVAERQSVAGNKERERERNGGRRRRKNLEKK